MRENFLVMAHRENTLSFFKIKADLSKKEILCLSRAEFPGAWDAPTLQRYVAAAFYPKRYTALFALDPSHAAEYYEEIALVRDAPAHPLDEADLDNLMSQAVWKLFEEKRASAARQLGCGELDLLLVDVRVHRIRIDGHEVVNPLRQGGKKIRIALSIIFMRRPAYVEMRSFLPRRAAMHFFVSDGGAASHTLARMTQEKRFLFARVSHAKTALFAATHGAISFFDALAWGEERLIHAIAECLKVDGVLAERIMERVMEGTVSRTVARALRAALVPELHLLVRGIRHAADAAGARRIFLDFPLLRREKEISTMVSIVESEQALDFFGFTCADDRGMQRTPLPRGKGVSIRNIPFAALAAFLEFYFLPNDNLVNHLARRRMRWLIPFDALPHRAVS